MGKSAKLGQAPNLAGNAALNYFQGALVRPA